MHCAALLPQVCKCIILYNVAVCDPLQRANSESTVSDSSPRIIDSVGPALQLNLLDHTKLQQHSPTVTMAVSWCHSDSQCVVLAGAMIA
jgi:hypothetical protein